MLKVDLITVGKLKEDYLRRACEEYQKRLGAFVKLQIIELPEGKMPQDPSAAQIESCIFQEGQSILSKIPAQSFVVAMCIEGQMLSSEQLAEIKQGQQVKVYADYGKEVRKEYPGIVTWISDTSEFTPKTILTKDERANLVYAVKIAVKNDGMLKIGMYGGCNFN